MCTWAGYTEQFRWQCGDLLETKTNKKQKEKDDAMQGGNAWVDLTMSPDVFCMPKGTQD